MAAEAGAANQQQWETPPSSLLKGPFGPQLHDGGQFVGQTFPQREAAVGAARELCRCLWDCGGLQGMAGGGVEML